MQEKVGRKELLLLELESSCGEKTKQTPNTGTVGCKCLHLTWIVLPYAVTLSSALSFLHSPILTSYMTTGKTIALTRRTLVGKVMSLHF